MAEVPPLCGLVLAGGYSRRLGTDKAAVAIGGQSLLDRAVRTLQVFCSDVRVAVRAEQQAEPLRAQYRCLLDPIAGIGPAAGMIAAHRERPEAAWIVLACDMPWVAPAVLQLLVSGRDPSRAGVAFRRASAPGPEPLCALYEPATLAAFRRQVETGGNASPRVWLAGTDALLLEAPAPGALDSINLREDLARLAAATDGSPLTQY